MYGLPRFYPYFVQELGWTRQQVTSGNAYSKIFVALAFGFLAGRLVDRFGPRRLMLGGIVMAGGALVGLSYVTSLGAFYFFYAFNALGYVFGGPLPNQVLLSRWFDKGRGKAMGIAYLGIGVGGALVPLLAFTLTQAWGWRGALRVLGLLMIAIALPMAYFVREPARAASAVASAVSLPSLKNILTRPAFYFLMLGSMASIGAVGGTIQNLALYLSLDRKLPQVEIDTTLSIILAGSVIGRLTMGWLADRWPKKHVMFLIYVIVALSIPMLVYAPTPTTLKICAFLFGIGLGGDYMIIPADGRRALRRRHPRPRHGHRAHRRQRVGVARADARRVDARHDRQLHVGLPVLVVLAAIGAVAVAHAAAVGSAPIRRTLKSSVRPGSVRRIVREPRASSPQSSPRLPTSIGRSQASAFSAPVSGEELVTATQWRRRVRLSSRACRAAACRARGPSSRRA